MKNPRPSSEPANSEPVLARRVWVAVNAAERRICGDAAVQSRAMAEGLALAGRRAARLIDPSRVETSPGAVVEAAWVDHRIRRGPHAPGGVHAFELSASSGQEAVDHCLVAQRIAANLRRPGLCTIDRALADTPQMVRLPEANWIETLPAVPPSSGGDASGNDVIEAARAAFAEVTRQTGRSLSAVSPFHMEGARYVVVAAGGLGPLARQQATALRRLGVPCGALVPALVRPFPTAVLGELLADAEAVAVLSSGADGFAEILARHAEAALGPDGATVGIVNVHGADGSSLCRELGRACGFDLPDLQPERPECKAQVTIGGYPSGPWMEQLLLDAVASLARYGNPALEIGASGPREIVTVTVGDRSPGERLSDDRSLDLLVVTRPADLTGTESLERVRECGAVLLQASTEEVATAWAVLSSEQRATMIRKRLRLCLVASDVDRQKLQRAILAAAPDVGRTVDCEGNDLDELRAGARTLTSVDPSRLNEPAAVTDTTERPAPRMPPAAGVVAADEWRERLRGFHFTSPASPGELPASWSSLRPAILDAEELRATHSPPESTLFESWTRTVLHDRRRRRAELLAEAGTLAEGLREILGLPADPGENGSVGDLTAKLGQFGAEFVNPQVLLDKVSERRDPRSLNRERKRRLAKALEGVERIRERVSLGWPIAYVLCAERYGAFDPADDVQVLTHEDGLRAAIGLVDGLAHEAMDLARSMRIARLEVGGNYDEPVHGPILDRLDRQSLTAEELLRMPTVVVVETARHLRGPALAAFSEVIRAGRPIHVLIEESVAELSAETLEPPSGYHPGLGYLAVAHREALVVQSSTGRAEHLAAGLERAVTALDPVVVVVAVPSPELPVPAGEQLEAAVQARATPCFVYDPAGGTSWAARFALDGNPQPESPWPRYGLACEDAEGRETQLDQAFTFAHVAALDPRWRPHFRTIGPEAWLDNQIEIAEYLELTDRARSRSLPYVWIVENGTLVRAVISWELAFACRDRARAWRILQELAGTDNVYVRRAAEETRRAVLEEADRRVEKLEADFAVALAAARSEGAAAALERLVRALTDPRGLVAATAAFRQPPGFTPAVLPPAPGAGANVSVGVPLAPVASEETGDVGLGEPYIDSFLCTTCNDCTNLNPQMFRYNENKQAEIANAAAGTFKQLVKAAEMCPARCIHPGAPMNGDATATPALLKRAAKFG